MPGTESSTVTSHSINTKTSCFRLSCLENENDIFQNPQTAASWAVTMSFITWLAWFNSDLWPPEASTNHTYTHRRDVTSRMCCSLMHLCQKPQRPGGIWSAGISSAANLLSAVILQSFVWLTDYTVCVTLCWHALPRPPAVRWLMGIISIRAKSAVEHRPCSCFLCLFSSSSSSSRSVERARGSWSLAGF